MAKIKAPIRTTGEPIKPENLIISDIRIQNVDRTPKDVAAWRNAHQNAESVHYPNRSRLYDLYSDVILDGHLTGIINKRIAAVRNKQLIFTKDGKQVEGMETIIKSMVFRNIITRIMETPAYGCTAMEFIPGAELAFEDINRKHVKPEFGIISKEQSDYTGYEYGKIDNVLVIGEKMDLGYLLKASFYALIKKGDFSDWGQYVEIFGQPVRIIKYDAYDTKTKIELKQVLDESGSSLALMIPKQADFEMMDGKGSNGDGQLQERLKNACNEEMSIIVLGNTESTSSNGKVGSGKLSGEHAKQQLEITKDDMAYTLGWLNNKKFIAILARYGLPVEGGAFEFEKELDLEALALKKDIDDVVSQKVPIDDDYWYDTYGIPKPKDYDRLKAEMVAQKQAKEAEPAPQPGKPVPGKKAPVKQGLKDDVGDNTNIGNNLSVWRKVRTLLADFFDPAP